MTHTFKYEGPGCGQEFEVHSFDFTYSTDAVNGAPAEHSAVGYLDIEVQMEAAQDSEGTNFKTARTELWTASKEAVKFKKEQLRSKITLTAKQSAQDEGSRKLVLEGWCVSYHESSHGGPQTANADTLRARFYIFAVKTAEKAGHSGPELS